MRLSTNNDRSNFIPDALARAVTSIDFSYWSQRGIKTVCLDLDSTLLPHGGTKLNADSLRFLKTQQIPLMIATNRIGKDKVRPIVRELGDVKVVTARSWLTKKPSKKYFQHLVELSGHRPQELLMVGDRIFQDMWGANRAGLNTCMVEKLGHQPWSEHILGLPDRLFLHLFGNQYE